MNRLNWPRAVAVALALALLASGCGPADNTAAVSGTVSYDGTPVADGSITFIPKDGQSATTGGVIKDGKYACRVPVGQAKVLITAAKEVGRKKVYPTPNSPEMPVMQEYLPDKYNTKTELTYDVKAGDQVKDFPLAK